MTVGAIQQLLDDLAAKLQRSVVVDDENIKLLYSSKHYGDEDEVRRRAVLQRDAGARTIGYVLAQGVTAWTRPGIIPANNELGLHTRVCVPVRWRGTFVGLLMIVDSEGTLTTAELSLATQASQDLAPLMIGEHPTEVDETARALADAVSDLGAAVPALQRTAVRALANHLDDHEEGHVRIIHLSAYEDRIPVAPGHVGAGLRYAVESLSGRPAAWTVLSSVQESSASVLVTSRSPISDEALSAYANALVKRAHAIAADRFRCVAGTGGASVGLERAPASFRQACLAAEAGRKFLSQPVVAWSELGELAVLLQLPLTNMDEECLPSEVQRLLAHDRDGRTVETVRALLDYAGSMPDAADALHVHRTTLYYRLERIRDATGLDFDDGRTRLALHLGLRLRDLLRTPSM